MNLVTMFKTVKVKKITFGIRVSECYKLLHKHERKENNKAKSILCNAATRILGSAIINEVILMGILLQTT